MMLVVVLVVSYCDGSSIPSRYTVMVVVVLVVSYCDVSSSKSSTYSDGSSSTSSIIL